MTDKSICIMVDMSRSIEFSDSFWVLRLGPLEGPWADIAEGT